MSKAYSKTWSHREDAILEVHKRLENGTFEDKDEVKAFFRATVFLLQRGMKDKVFAVLNAVMNLNKFLFTDFVDRHQIPKPDTHYAVDKVRQKFGIGRLFIIILYFNYALIRVYQCFSYYGTSYAL